MCYKQGNSDHTLFVKQVGEKVVILIYLDDMVITESHEEEMTNLKKRLAYEFDLKDLGKLRYFLSIEFARSKECIVESEKIYSLTY